MDQHSLPLKLFKKQQSKNKQSTLLLKRKRNCKKKLTLLLSDNPFSPIGKSLSKKYPDSPLFIKPKKEINKTRKKKKKNKFQSLKQGQIVIEGLFFMICILFFLTAIQLFQSLARKEIQKQRLTKQNSYKAKIIKAPWYKPLKE